MPSGRTHDRITWLTAPPVGAAAWLLGAEGGQVAALVGTYLFGGLMFGGDLDIHSRQYRRWGPLRWIWLPYRRLVSHRSVWSHGPIVGTLGRIVYLALWLALLLALAALLGLPVGAAPLDWAFNWANRHGVFLLWCLAGLEAGAMSHSLSDWLGSAFGQLRRRFHPRRGQR